MTDDSYFFVSRLRKNAVTQVIEPFKLPTDSVVLSDEMILIGTTQSRAENVFRLNKVLDSKGNELHLITNRFDVSADEIAELYKSRWAIELFFKWLKQHLNNKKFYAQSEQGVHNQVYISMIVYCLHVASSIGHKQFKDILTNQSFTESSTVEIRSLMDSKNRRKGFL